MYLFWNKNFTGLNIHKLKKKSDTRPRGIIICGFMVYTLKDLCGFIVDLLWIYEGLCRFKQIYEDLFSPKWIYGVPTQFWADVYSSLCTKFHQSRSSRSQFILVQTARAGKHSKSYIHHTNILFFPMNYLDTFTILYVTENSLYK